MVTRPRATESGLQATSSPHTFGKRNGSAREEEPGEERCRAAPGRPECPRAGRVPGSAPAGSPHDRRPRREVGGDPGIENSLAREGLEGGPHLLRQPGILPDGVWRSEPKRPAVPRRGSTVTRWSMVGCRSERGESLTSSDARRMYRPKARGSGLCWVADQRFAQTATSSRFAGTAAACC